MHGQHGQALGNMTPRELLNVATTFYIAIWVGTILFSCDQDCLSPIWSLSERCTMVMGQMGYIPVFSVWPQAWMLPPFQFLAIRMRGYKGGPSRGVHTNNFSTKNKEQRAR